MYYKPTHRNQNFIHIHWDTQSTIYILIKHWGIYQCILLYPWANVFVGERIKVCTIETSFYFKLLLSSEFRDCVRYNKASWEMILISSINKANEKWIDESKIRSERRKNNTFCYENKVFSHQQCHSLDKQLEIKKKR